MRYKDDIIKYLIQLYTIIFTLTILFSFYISDTKIVSNVFLNSILIVITIYVASKIVSLIDLLCQLITGLISKYKFCLLKIGSMYIYGEDKLKVTKKGLYDFDKIENIVLFSSPNINKLFFVSGLIGNIIVCVSLFIIFNLTTITTSPFLLIYIIYSFSYIIMNLIPTNINFYSSGYFLFNKRSTIDYEHFVKIVSYVLNNDTYNEIEEYLFLKYNNINNFITYYIAMSNYYYLLDDKKYARAKKVIKDIYENINTLPTAYRNHVYFEYIFINSVVNKSRNIAVSNYMFVKDEFNYEHSMYATRSDYFFNKVFGKSKKKYTVNDKNLNKGLYDLEVELLDVFTTKLNTGQPKKMRKSKK